MVIISNGEFQLTLACLSLLGSNGPDLKSFGQNSRECWKYSSAALKSLWDIRDRILGSAIHEALEKFLVASGGALWSLLI